MREPQIALSERIEQLATLPWRRLARARNALRTVTRRCLGSAPRRTGTSSWPRSSCSASGTRAGIRARGRRSSRSDYEPIFAVAERFDSFEDGPWNGRDFYRDLDGGFPGSKFVLTVRDQHSWLRSHERHFGRRSSQDSGAVPDRGLPRSGASEILRDYQGRNEEVRGYFADRPADLLVLDVVGEGWERPARSWAEAPARPFPHLNAG